MVRNGAGSLKVIAAPSAEADHRQAQNESVTHFEPGPAQDLAGCLRTHDRCELVFFRETGDGLAGAGGVLIDQKHDPPVKRLRSESLCNHKNRLVAQSESEQQRDQGNFLGRYPVEPGEVFLLGVLSAKLREW